jgi:Mrp family chromosome partitioning ATPase
MSLIERVAQRIDDPDTAQAESRYKGGQQRDRPADSPVGMRKDERVSWTQPREAGARERAAEPAAFSPPFKHLSRRGFITPNARRSRLSEEVRLVKRQLMRQMELDGNEREEADRIIMVTSARPGEGKSFVALNLALSFAIDEHIPALLIDTDYARSTYDRLLHIPRSPGLIETLLDSSLSLGLVMRRAEGLPLAFVPPGGCVASATDLYAGPRMAALLREACRAHTRGVVIIDGPSLLSTTEALVLAPQAKQILLVVDADHTSKSAVQSALELLEPCKNVSLALNMVARGAAERFGSYYVHGAPMTAAASATGR